MSFTQPELDAALAALGAPGRLSAAQDLVARLAPELQQLLGDALRQGGWFDTAHEAALEEANSVSGDDERLAAVSTLFAEETRLTMLVGVAVGFELARELGYSGTGDRAGQLDPSGTGDRAGQLDPSGTGDPAAGAAGSKPPFS